MVSSTRLPSGTDEEPASVRDSLCNEQTPYERIPVQAQFRAALRSKINVLLIFVPMGFGINYAHIGNPWPNFIINFIAIIPLAAMLSFATEELAFRVGETFGGLLNASFGYIFTNC